jgi:hypothetical protein
LGKYTNGDWLHINCSANIKHVLLIKIGTIQHITRCFQDSKLQFQNLYWHNAKRRSPRDTYLDGLKLGWLQVFLLQSSSRSRGYFTADIMSWYRVPFWDLRLDITSCRNFDVWRETIFICKHHGFQHFKVSMVTQHSHYTKTENRSVY